MDYKKIIEAKYNRKDWQDLLRDIFHNNVRFFTSVGEVKVNSRLAKSAIYLGNISLSDGESLAVYEVELADNVDIVRNRRGIRDMLTKDWRDAGYAGAFMFCYRKTKVFFGFPMLVKPGGLTKTANTKKSRLTQNATRTY